MEITLDTKIYDLLKAYPQLEDELIKINPKFKKLKNPILRRTVARIASIRQAAAVGGMDSVELLNEIRKRVGLPALDIKEEESSQSLAPEWITKEPVKIIDANALLDQGKNPLAEIMKELKNMEKEDVLLLTSDFKPQPLIDELVKKGYEVYSKDDGQRFFTYIRK